jgi:molybdate transport repressor ModE-like protein
MAVNFNRVLLLAEVIQCGSVSGAAKRLGLSQSAVSQQIARFEEELDVQLLERHGRNVRATRAGLRVAEAANMLHNVSGFVAGALNDLASEEEICLQMFCFRSASLAVLPAALSTFEKHLPRTTISLREISTFPDLAHSWYAGNFELGLVHEQTFFSAPAPSDVERTVLLDEPMGVLMPNHHPLAQHKALMLSELHNEHWIVEQNATVGYLSFATATQLAGFTPRVRCQTSALEIIAALVPASGGIALLPSITGPPRPPGTTFVPLAFPEIHRMLVAVSPMGPKRHVAQVMEDALVSAAAGLLTKRRR